MKTVWVVYRVTKEFSDPYNDSTIVVGTYDNYKDAERHYEELGKRYYDYEYCVGISRQVIKSSYQETKG